MDDQPSLADIMRDEMRICREFERDHPGLTLDDMGAVIPKPPASTAQRCDTCTVDRSACGKNARDNARTICCPTYRGPESFGQFQLRWRAK